MTTPQLTLNRSQRFLRNATVGLSLALLFITVSLIGYMIVRTVDLFIFQIIFILLLVAFASNVAAKMLTYHIRRS